MAKSKSKRPTVKGPQLTSRVLAGKTKSLGKANGEPPRTARMRYMEPPAKRKGNPFVAVRVPAEMLEAFERLCTKRKTTPAAAVRSFISDETGVGGDDE